ncbi:MAG: dihydropteroate synthase [Actinomycetales bacterium]
MSTAAASRHPAGLPQALLDRLAGTTRSLVMGVVNVTPDSFSDGGLWLEPDAAVGHGLELAAQGADLVDVGGESTRPGAQRPDVAEELRRVVPVVRELSAAGVVVSIDTMRAEVAEAALAAGAALVNDVSGGQADPHLPPLVADAGVPYVVMHWRGHSTEMEQHASYDDVVADVGKELSARLESVVAQGVSADRVVLDPGLGFAKDASQNWALLRGLDQLVGLGRPLLVGASRKRFLGSLLAGPDGTPAPPDARDAATHATSALAAAAGVWCVRVHDVPGTLDAVRVADAWLRAGGARG